MLGTYLRYLYRNVTNQYHKGFIRSLEKNPKAIFLDAGCWDGMNAEKWAGFVGTKNIHGVELVRTAAAEAKKRGIKVEVGDLNFPLKQKSNTFDVIVSNHVIEHLYRPHIFVEEMYRILKPGGYFVLGTPNLASWHNIFALLIGRQPYSGPTVEITQKDFSASMKKEKNTKLMEDVTDKAAGESALGHIVVQTLPTLRKLLIEKGFTVENVGSYGYHPLPPILANIAASIDKRHAHYVIVKARKRRNP